jgi:hypothetical protein
VRGERDSLVHRAAPVDEPAQVETPRQLFALDRVATAQPQRLEAGLAQPQEVLHAQRELLIVPGLGDVVRRALLDERHRVLQRRPRREQHDRQIGIERPNRAKQLDPLEPRRRVLGEVHVLDHDPHVLSAHDVERFIG